MAEDVINEFETLNSILPADGSLVLKRLDQLLVGDIVEGVGRVIEAEPGKAPIVEKRSRKGEMVKLPLNKREPSYQVSVYAKLQ